MSKNLFISGLITLGLAVAGCSGSSNSPTTPIPTAPNTTPYAASPSPYATATPATSYAGDTKQVMLKGSLAFVDSKTGLALYTYDADTTPDQSNCTGTCLTVWPSHAAITGEMAAAGFTIFKRSDNGTYQWAYYGKPLYTYIKDTTTYNGTGDGVDGFHIARPQATPTTTPTTQPTSVPTPAGH